MCVATAGKDTRRFLWRAGSPSPPTSAHRRESDIEVRAQLRVVDWPGGGGGRRGAMGDLISSSASNARERGAPAQIFVPGSGGDQEVVLYTGWLLKQGGVFPTWKRRFFQLMSGGKLRYFRREAGGPLRADAVGEIKLHGATVSKNFASDPAGVLEVG